VNTGWTGGAYGTGSRMKLSHTRAMVRAAVAGQLDAAPTATDPVFGLAVPQQVEGVPTEVMNPRGTWPDGAEYDAQAAKLAGMFRENIKKFGAQVSEAILAAGPKA
jgi:phosphoenolpyruvate carboxykinase (ATP)